MKQAAKQLLQDIAERRSVDKNLVIRGIPAEVHRALKVRAAERGISLSSFLVEILTDAAEGLK